MRGRTPGGSAMIRPKGTHVSFAACSIGHAQHAVIESSLTSMQGVEWARGPHTPAANWWTGMAHRPSMKVGARRHSACPVPSCPCALLPQAYTWEVAVTQRVCAMPHTTWLTCMPCTSNRCHVSASHATTSQTGACVCTRLADKLESRAREHR